MNVYFHTLGCKVNQYETEAVKQVFFENGYEITNDYKIADIFVINSCTVTNMSDKKTKQQLRKFKSLNKNSIIAVIGCFPQAFEEEAKKIEQADIIMGTDNKLNLINNIKKFLTTKERIIDIKKLNKNDKFSKMSVSQYFERTRAIVKIQDGCNRYCTYCIIPKARGYLKSKPLDELKKEVTELANNGYKEIVLVGINVCFYGENEGFTLVDGIKTVSEIEGIERIRLGSLEPYKMDIDVLKSLSKIDKFCPSFHLSLQSGDDEVLFNMRRHYTTKEYFEIVQNIYNIFNNPSITTDIIVGFPGENDENFLNTVDFVKSCKMLKIHVFPYSKRDGTKAAAMTNQVQDYIKTKRTKELIKVAQELREEFFKTQINIITNILVEKQISKNVYEGYTKNYVPVIIESEKNISNEIVTVKIINHDKNYCKAILI